MKVHVVSEDGIGGNAKVMLADGTPLMNCARLVLMLAPNEMVTAQATFILPQVDVVGHVTVSEDHLRELAFAHGYTLTRRSD